MVIMDRAQSINFVKYNKLWIITIFLEQDQITRSKQKSRTNPKSLIPSTNLNI